MYRIKRPTSLRPYVRSLALLLMIFGILVRPAIVLAQEGITNEQRTILRTPGRYFNYESADASSCGTSPTGGGSGGAGGQLSTNVPSIWRDLIMGIAGQYPSVDPRTVAAELWIENRGWPEFKTSGWGVSEAAAQGPWQFIPSTWASMGTDGDGDGRADPDNPKDAVHAAFKHNVGSSPNPIAFVGYDSNKTPEQNFQTVTYSDRSGDLLSHIGKYNGSGAPDGVQLKNFGRGQNSDYVIMGYWLLATDFKTGWEPNDNTFMDATRKGRLFEGAGGAENINPASVGTGGANNCPSNKGGSVDGYAFPVAPQQKGQNSGVPGMSGLPCTNDNCHHDNTVAFDISRLPGGDAIAGTPLYAITDGEVINIRDSYQGVAGCNSFQLHGLDTYYYWYGHIQGVTVSEGQKVKAGDQVAVIGERKCTGNGSDSHLHIDRGCVQGGVPQYGGYYECRDPAFKDIINKLFEALPN